MPGTFAKIPIEIHNSSDACDFRVKHGCVSVVQEVESLNGISRGFLKVLERKSFIVRLAPVGTPLWSTGKLKKTL